MIPNMCLNVIYSSKGTLCVCPNVCRKSKNEKLPFQTRILLTHIFHNVKIHIINVKSLFVSVMRVSKNLFLYLLMLCYIYVVFFV